MKNMKNPIARHWTIRLRLTVLYGALFLVAGSLLLGVTYFLVDQRINKHSSPYAQMSRQVLQGNPLHQSNIRVQLADGRWVTAAEMIEAFQAQRRKDRQNMMNSLLAMGGLALLGVGVISAGLGWMFAGRALRPVHRITETAQRIAAAGSGRGLHERIALTGPTDEVKQLADTFDLMLERLDRSFDGQRRFVASASHEMRTPLAVSRALIEVMTTRPDASPDAKEMGTALLANNSRHETLIDGLLTLAESENTPAERQPVDLAEIVKNVLSEAAAPARDAGVAIQEPQLAEATVNGDPLLLERLVQNLVDNAIRHNRPGEGWLTARTWSAGDQVRLEIANTGPVIQPYQTESLFQPFRRLSGRHSSGPDRGFGLGLAIVRAIASAHGGHAHATPLHAGGLTVTIALPAASAVV